jgi:hypothetical protein
MPTAEARRQGINRRLAGKSPIAADSPINLGWMQSVSSFSLAAGKAQWCNVCDRQFRDLA